MPADSSLDFEIIGTLSGGGLNQQICAVRGRHINLAVLAASIVGIFELDTILGDLLPMDTHRGWSARTRCSDSTREKPLKERCIALRAVYQPPELDLVRLHSNDRRKTPVY